jgi:hypothetical protein
MLEQPGTAVKAALRLTGEKTATSLWDLPPGVSISPAFVVEFERRWTIIE